MNEWSKETFTLMIEPIKECNLRCRYCYSDNRHGDVITHEVLKQALIVVADYTSRNGFTQIDLIWHGGEPLLAGLPFYRQAAALLKKIGMTPPHCRQLIQTNGLLLDDNFCRFFKDENVHVGLSLDGPADLHDHFRIGAEGDGTHQLVLGKIDVVKRQGLPVGFNAAVSRLAKDRAGDLYRFFQELGYGFGVNPLIPPKRGPNESEWFLKKGEYGAFLCDLFDQWSCADKNRVRVSPLDRYLQSVLTGQPVGCQHELACIGAHIAIKPSGDATVCSRFETPILGNVLHTPVETLFRAPLGEAIRRRAENLPECRSCENWSICHGGCPHNIMAFQQLIFSKDPFCRDYKMIFRYLRKRLRNLKRAEPCLRNQ